MLALETAGFSGGLHHPPVPAEDSNVFLAEAPPGQDAANHTLSPLCRNNHV